MIVSKMVGFLFYPLHTVFYKGGTRMGKTDQYDEVFSRIRELLSTLQFGSITLIVQDGKVIQIEKNEKVRLK